jgi:riboflavin kinase
LIVAERKLCGVIFSDLGRAKVFMSLDWVKSALRERLGFSAYPATLNLRLSSEEDKRVWRDIQKTTEAIEIVPPNASFCAARLYRVAIERASARLEAAVLVPEVKGYPQDKLEIVAPVQIKNVLGVQDGESLAVVFGAG